MDEQYLDSEFDRADGLISQDLIEEAKAVLNSILEENPRYGKAHNHLGWICKTKENNVKTAENHYKQALELTPEYGATYINYAYLLSEEKRYAELENLLTKAESVENVNRSNLAREWGYFYEDTKQYPKAIEKYKEYAVSLYDNSLIDKAKEGILRCKQKLEIMEM
ncbi:MAG: hypothetical protein LBE36_07025 [Flavobacteriaceae bacterium]|jgi:tetratricopeptide (TPR) repeat protein|nr:hypothetical protein [Flavobacteriaceae bacterium]